MSKTVSNTAPLRTPGGRAHDLDGLRAVLMILVCVGHALLIYSYGVPWFISSPDRSWLLTGLVAVLTSFHMPGFFLLAGYFAMVSLGRKDPDNWMGARIERLLVPLLTSIILISPFAILAATLAAQQSQVTLDAGFGTDFEANLQVLDFRWVGHLWFLSALFAFSVMTWLLARFGLLQPLARAIAGFILSLRRARMAWLFAVVTAAVLNVGVIAVVWVLQTRFSYQPILGGLIEVRAWLAHLPFFFMGVLFAVSPELRAELTRVTRLRLAVALSVLVMYVVFWTRTDFEGRAIKTLMEGLISLSMVFLSMAAAKAFLSKPSRILRRMSDLSLSVYLVHYPIVLFLGVLFLNVNWPPAAEFVVITIGMLVASFAVALLIESSRALTFLFNGISSAHQKVAKKA